MRDEIDSLIGSGARAEAAAAMARMFASAPTAGTAAFVTSRFERMAAGLPLTPFRIAILRSFTIEPLLPFLRTRCYLAGVDADVWVGPYNTFAQEILDPASALFAFRPDAVFVAALTRDFAPALWLGDGDLQAEVEAARALLEQWVSALRRHSHASVIVHAFDQPSFAALGVADTQIDRGQRNAIRELNGALSAIAASHRGVYVLDYDALVSRHGRANWGDPHKDLAMRVPLRSEGYGWLADEYMRFIHPLTGRVCKAIAIDLDNTLWGGVVGEEGASGIALGAEYPGPAFTALQQYLKALSRRGILLTICSKNNQDEALAMLRDHPGMVLRPNDFAAMRINWDDKAGNLRSLAAELNIGVDSFAFLDDSPVEREWIRSQLPEVTVIDLPADPVMFVDTLQRTPVFERLSVSAEDTARTELYRQERLRKAGEASHGSIEDFLRSLEMTATIDDVNAGTLARVAQLTQKTNQFNATTKRYSEEQVARFAADPGAIVRTIRVADRYGDNGLVGVLMARTSGERCEIDTLLLSCRVIGRGVETVMLSDVGALARSGGARVLAGRFVPTSKNAPAQDVYARHGFAAAQANGDGTVWELDLKDGTPKPPDHIDVRRT